MQLPACPFCGDPVVGIAGQDIALDTFYLSTADTDNAVVNRGLFGLSHLSCLMESDVGAFWSTRIVENLTRVRSFPAIGSDNAHVLLRNDRLNETVAIGRDGWMVHLDDASVRRREPFDEGFLIPHRQELNLDLTDFPSAVADLSVSAASGDEYPLLSLLGLLHITNRLLVPRALERASLERVAISVNFVAAAANYHKFVPRSVGVLAAAALPDRE